MRVQLILLSLCVSILGLSMFSPLAQARYKGEPSEKMMQFKSFLIMGVTIDMTVGEIMRKLESRGLKFDCRHSACIARGNGFDFTVVHTKKSLGNRNVAAKFDPNVTPVSIAIGNVTDFSVCGAAKEMIRLYCNKDDQRQPCMTDNFGVTKGAFSSQGKSSDGFIYRANVMLNPGKICSVGVTRI